MSTIKLLLAVLLLITIPLASHSQNPTVDCSQDSALNLALSKMLDTTKTSNIQNLILLDYTVFSPDKKRDCFCDLLIYARIFDFLLEKELNLNYQVKQNPPVNNSTNFPTTLAQINSNNKFNTFQRFLHIKHNYEKSVLKRYNHDKSRMLTRDVENILQYHIYAYPGTLKDILLGKYGHLTLGKLQAEVFQYFGEPTGKN